MTKKTKETIYSKTPITQIIDFVKFKNFVEVIGKAGSDVLAFRIYADGTVVER